MPKQLQNSTIGPLKTSKPIANPSGILISEIEKEINDVKRFNFEEDNLFEKIQTSPDNIDSHNLERRLSVEAPIFRQPSLKNAPKIATVKALDYDTSQKESQANQQESRTERIEIAAQEDPSPKESLMALAKGSRMCRPQPWILVRSTRQQLRL
ncbi:hypothetical protein BY996DRAFT_6427686 [Phakopsora pachyrhizi]|nr:hypothetical protein BY996DRAFT_6427686 [Phakopsora pachyrhizi]